MSRLTVHDTDEAQPPAPHLAQFDELRSHAAVLRSLHDAVEAVHTHEQFGAFLPSRAAQACMAELLRQVEVAHISVHGDQERVPASARLQVPYMHAVALLVQDLAGRDRPAPHRWAWLFHCCREQLEGKGLLHLPDRVRDLSAMAAAAAGAPAAAAAAGPSRQLLPQFFGVGASPPFRITLMEAFLYTLAAAAHTVVREERHGGAATPASDPTGVTLCHVEKRGHGSLYDASSSTPRVPYALLEQGQGPAFAFSVMTDRELARQDGPAFLAALGRREPTHPRLAAVLAAAEATAAVARAAMAPAEAAVTRTAAAAAAAARALRHALRRRKEQRQARRQAGLGAGTGAAAAGAAAADAEVAAARVVAAGAVRDEAAAQGVWTSANLERVVTESRRSIAVEAAHSAAVAERYAAAVREPLNQQLLRSSVSPDMHVFTANLRPQELFILSDLCQQPPCRVTSLRCPDRHALDGLGGGALWPAAAPARMWETWRGRRTEECRAALQTPAGRRHQQQLQELQGQKLQQCLGLLPAAAAALAAVDWQAQRLEQEQLLRLGSRLDPRLYAQHLLGPDSDSIFFNRELAPGVNFRPGSSSSGGGASSGSALDLTALTAETRGATFFGPAVMAVAGGFPPFCPPPPLSFGRDRLAAQAFAEAHVDFMVAHRPGLVETHEEAAWLRRAVVEHLLAPAAEPEPSSGNGGGGGGVARVKRSRGGR